MGARDRRCVRLLVGLGARLRLDAHRIAPASGRITKRIRLGAAAAYNIWIGGGSVWVADDQGARVIRVSPGTNRVLARPSVGDGPADMAFAGTSA